MSSGSAGLAALSVFASLFSVTFCVVCGLDGMRLVGLSFFAAFFFLAVFGCWLTSSVIPQRSSKDSCTPSEYFGRGSISGFSSTGCGFSVGVSTVCAEDTVSNFIAGRSTSFWTLCTSMQPPRVNKQLCGMILFWNFIQHFHKTTFPLICRQTYNLTIKIYSVLFTNSSDLIFSE